VKFLPEQVDYIRGIIRDHNPVAAVAILERELTVHAEHTVMRFEPTSENHNMLVTFAKGLDDAGIVLKEIQMECDGSMVTITGSARVKRGQPDKVLGGKVLVKERAPDDVETDTSRRDAWGAVYKALGKVMPDWRKKRGPDVWIGEAATMTIHELHQAHLLTPPPFMKAVQEALDKADPDWLKDSANTTKAEDAANAINKLVADRQHSGDVLLESMKFNAEKVKQLQYDLEKAREHAEQQSKVISSFQADMDKLQRDARHGRRALADMESLRRSAVLARQQHDKVLMARGQGMPVLIEVIQQTEAELVTSVQQVVELQYLNAEWEKQANHLQEALLRIGSNVRMTKPEARTVDMANNATADVRRQMRQELVASQVHKALEDLRLIINRKNDKLAEALQRVAALENEIQGLRDLYRRRFNEEFPIGTNQAEGDTTASLDLTGVVSPQAMAAHEYWQGSQHLPENDPRNKAASTDFDKKREL